MGICFTPVLGSGHQGLEGIRPRREKRAAGVVSTVGGLQLLEEGLELNISTRQVLLVRPPTAGLGVSASFEPIKPTPQAHAPPPRIGHRPSPRSVYPLRRRLP